MAQKRHVGLSLDHAIYRWTYARALSQSTSMASIIRRALLAAMEEDASPVALTADDKSWLFSEARSRGTSAADVLSRAVQSLRATIARAAALENEITNLEE